MKRDLKIILATCLLFLSISPYLVQAADIEHVLKNIAKYLGTLAQLVAGIFIIIGGYMIVTAAGDPEKLRTGQRSILYAMVGLVILLIYKALVSLAVRMAG